jgi:cysteine synthase
MNTFKAIESYLLLANSHTQQRYYYWLHNQLGTPLEWLQHEYTVHRSIEADTPVTLDWLDNLNALG